MGFRPDSLKSWLRSLLADGESIKRSSNGIVGYTPVSTTGAETLTNKTLTAPVITSPSLGNGASIETASVATTDGTVTTTRPSTHLDIVQPIGLALSSTEFLLDMGSHSFGQYGITIDEV